MIYAILITQTAIIAALGWISAMLYAHIKILITRANDAKRRIEDLEYWRMEQGSGSPYSIVSNNTYGRGPYD